MTGATMKRRRTRRNNAIPLNTDELARLRGHLRAIACSPGWVDAIVEAVTHRRVAYATTAEGKLKTKVADLMIAIAEAGIYPPAADDRPRFAAVVDGRGMRQVVEVHLGSQMRPCLSASCTCAESGTEPTSILYPAEYAKHGVCYTCHVNQTPLDERAAELGFTVSALASATAIAARQCQYYGRRINHQKTRQGRFPKLRERRHDLAYAGIE